jgi:hypothetical protein
MGGVGCLAISAGANPIGQFDHPACINAFSFSSYISVSFPLYLDISEHLRRFLALEQKVVGSFVFSASFLQILAKIFAVASNNNKTNGQKDRLAERHT